MNTGNEKKVNNNFLCTAPTAKQAYERIEESLKGLMSTFEIGAITLTKIVEVIHPNSKENE
jgi:hypothetical protein